MPQPIVYTDTSAVRNGKEEFHMDVGREEFRKFSDLIDLMRIDVYGRVSDAVMDRLHRKARMLGDATVAVHDFHAGFARLTQLDKRLE